MPSLSPTIIKTKLLRLLVSAGLQTAAIQLLGLVFFFLVSKYLPKEEFGVINWCNAVAVTITVVAGLGLEQVVLRRSAAGTGRSSGPASTFFIHAIFSSVFSGLWLVAAAALLPQGPKTTYLPLFFAAQAFVFIATPVRVLLNSKRRFLPYAAAALLANALKLGGAFFFLKQGALSVGTVGMLLVGAGMVEWGLAFGYARLKLGFRPRFHARAYRALIKESLPQYLAVILDAGLARLDWILLGVLVADQTATAEYSFAYRAFEFGRMPLVVAGAVFLPWASKVAAAKAGLGAHQHRLAEIFALLLFCGFAIAGAMNLLWVPGVEALTEGKYGRSNERLFFLLSLCLPLQFVINFFWTVLFSSKQYRTVSRITAIVAFVNLGSCLALISLFGALGAAIAFLGTTVVQAVLYAVEAHRLGYRVPVKRALLIAGMWVVVMVTPLQLGAHWSIALGVFVVLFPVLCLALRCIKPGALHLPQLPLSE